MSTLLVTGASGFVGFAVASELALAGKQVIALDPAPPPGDCGAAVFIREALGSAHELARLLDARGVTKVIHAGGISGPMLARDNPLAVCQANIGATLNLVEAARRKGVDRFVYCSSASVFGHTPAPPVPDDAPLRPTNLYGATKAACDLMIGAYRTSCNLDAIALRLSNIYGPGRRTDCAVKTIIMNALAGRTTRFDWGIGCRRPYLFIADAVSAVICALNAPRTPQYAYNIAGPEMVEMVRIGEFIAAEIPGAKVEFGLGPDPLGYRRQALGISAAARDLGFFPQYGFERGLTTYLQWFRDGCKLGI